jgi:hypothetical protein
MEAISRAERNREPRRGPLGPEGTAATVTRHTAPSSTFGRVNGMDFPRPSVQEARFCWSIRSNEATTEIRRIEETMSSEAAVGIL